MPDGNTVYESSALPQAHLTIIQQLSVLRIDKGGRLGGSLVGASDLGPGGRVLTRALSLCS